MDDSTENEQRRQLAQVMKIANLSVSQLWLRYFGSGGSVGEYEVDAYVQGLISLPELQRDLLALATNELVDELPALPRVPFAKDIELRETRQPSVSQDAEDRKQRPAGSGVPEDADGPDGDKQRRGDPTGDS